MKNNYSESIDILKTNYPNNDFEQGLSSGEANKLLLSQGPNKLDTKKIPKWYLFIRQFNNMIIYILLVAAFLTVVMGHLSDAMIIGIVVVINALIGYFQEANASDALEKIKKMLSEYATVFRDGTRMDIPTEDLVVRDVVFLEAGDRVPADLRIVDSDNLKIQEATLTGEADSIEKNANDLKEEGIPLAEQYNQAFASTTVTNGSGVGIVIATAENTEIGKISVEVNQVKKRKSPLIQQIDNLGKGVSYIVIGAAILLFLLGLFLETYSLSVLSLAIVTMIVGSIPEGLPATTSVILAMGVSDMAKNKHTIVKSLPAVETLGSVDIIATDKTGTLTKNEMTITDIILNKHQYNVSGNGYNPMGEITEKDNLVNQTGDLELFIKAGYEANDTLLYEANSNWKINGEPTDGSFITLYYKYFGVTKKTEYYEIDMLPFDSDYRYIAKLVKNDAGDKFIFIKGSPDKIFPMSKTQDKKWSMAVNKLSKQGKRVVAVGYKQVSSDIKKITHDLLKEGLELIGIAGIIDPPRTEIIESLKDIRKAGIDVKMITGDHPLTAKTIGEKLGLASKINVITGSEWDKLSQLERESSAIYYQVFARTTPKNKLEIIEALQSKNKTTAMIGDGVNDAPALKRSDIGVAMGIQGTDVAKDSADVVLTNDNFATMSIAIREGRRIYDNIKKSILFLLPTSFAEGLIIAFTILMQQEMPLQATQLLWINMVSAVTIQFAFIFEPAEESIMNRSPLKVKNNLMNKHDVFQMIYVSIIMAFVSIVAHDWLLNQGVSQIIASTMMVNIIVFSKIFYLFNIRTSKFVFSKEIFSNKIAFLIVGIMILLQIIFTYIPFMQNAFHTSSMNLSEWSVTIIAGSLILFITETDKWIRTKKIKTKISA